MEANQGGGGVSSFDDVRRLEKIGRIIKYNRKKLKMSGQKLANTVGIQVNALSLIENGKRKRFPAVLCNKIFNVLGISWSDVSKEVDQ